MASVLTIKERTEKINIINDNLGNVPDDILTHVYKNVNNEINQKKKVKNEPKTSRFEKIQYVENNLRYVADEDIIEIESLINEDYEETQQKKLERVALKIINKLLEAKEKPKINNLCDFTMTRDEILSDECCDVINNNKQYIFENGFSKTDCKVNQSGTKYKHFSLFKGMIGQIEGHLLQSKLRFKSRNYEREAFTEYHIVKS